MKGGLYEQVLERLAGKGLPEPRPPRPSASVVLWRRAPSGTLEAFWVERGAQLVFMGGWYAFPGGGLAKDDADVEIAGHPSGAEIPAAGSPDSLAGEVAGLGEDLAPGILSCALRELFEETGVLPGEEKPSASLAAARRKLLEGETAWPELVQSHHLSLDVDSLVFAGRWLTPPFAPRRFDNRFFLLEWPAGRALQPEIVPGELASGAWIEPGRGLALWRQRSVLAAPPILHILQVLADEGPHAGHSRLIDPSETNLGPFRRIEFVPGVLLFPLRTPTLPPAGTTNAYLVGRGEAVLVDPGSPFENENQRLLDALRETERRLGRRAIAIWLTHHHPDHVGGVEAMRNALGVPVLAHPETAARLAERGIAVDRELSEGQEVELAGEPVTRLRVLHTPGHARGHLCFELMGEDVVIAGDLVAGLGTVVIDPPEGDLDQYLASLERLRKLSPAVLLPGHGPAIRDGKGKAEEYIDHRRWREARILEAWRNGARTPREILPLAYDDVPAVAHPLAERQILAHLESLRRRDDL